MASRSASPPSPPQSDPEYWSRDSRGVDPSADGLDPQSFPQRVYDAPARGGNSKRGRHDPSSDPSSDSESEESSSDYSSDYGASSGADYQAMEREDDDEGQAWQLSEAMAKYAASKFLIYQDDSRARQILMENPPPKHGFLNTPALDSDIEETVQKKLRKS